VLELDQIEAYKKEEKNKARPTPQRRGPNGGPA